LREPAQQPNEPERFEAPKRPEAPERAAAPEQPAPDLKRAARAWGSPEAPAVPSVLFNESAPAAPAAARSEVAKRPAEGKSIEKTQSARVRTEASQVALAFAARLTPVRPPARPTEREPAPEAGRPQEIQPEAGEGQSEAPRPMETAARPAAANNIQAPAADVARAPVDRTGSGAADTTAQSRLSRIAPPPREAAPAAPVARDIRLEVGSPERKVEVRLVERAGEVHMAVRTPDGRLAEGLRDQLPQLSSRLEQSGFHADEWRAADAGTAERRIEVQAPSSGSADARQQGNSQHERRERDGEPHPAHDAGQQQRRNKEKGNPFPWLMESLR
jgi:hypothetical protein